MFHTGPGFLNKVFHTFKTCFTYQKLSATTNRVETITAKQPQPPKFMKKKRFF